MERPRGISSGEAMRWNDDVERRRKAYHEIRCSENPLYRRAYERLQNDRRRMQEQIGKGMAQIADAMNADRQQRFDGTKENVEQQPARAHKEVSHDIGTALGIAFAATMLADREWMERRLKELEEERPYAEEIRKADQDFDRELIRMSGFEW